MKNGWIVKLLKKCNFTNFMNFTDSNTVFLWDMDGVLIDSLALDLKVLNPLLKKEFQIEKELSKEYIKSMFAYAVPEFCKMILEKVGKFSEENLRFFITEFERLRKEASFDLCPNVLEILKNNKNKNAVQYVVSNNKEEDIEMILKNCGILNFFEGIVGYDSVKNLKKKPEPDIYLFAINKVVNRYPNVKEFVIVEDTVVGVKAGLAAREELRTESRELRISVYGVATGGDSFEDLERAAADEVCHVIPAEAGI